MLYLSNSFPLKQIIVVLCVLSKIQSYVSVLADSLHRDHPWTSEEAQADKIYIKIMTWW